MLKLSDFICLRSYCQELERDCMCIMSILNFEPAISLHHVVKTIICFLAHTFYSLLNIKFLISIHVLIFWFIFGRMGTLYRQKLFIRFELKALVSFSDGLFACRPSICLSVTFLHFYLHIRKCWVNVNDKYLF